MNIVPDFKQKELTQKLIKAFYTVYNTLGYGFLEKVYENALMVELRKQSIQATQQQNLKVYYEKEIVGDYYADIHADNSVIIELKTAETLKEDDKYQLINSLRATESEVGLLINFGKKPEFRRVVFSNSNKQFAEIS
ncbi:MAG: GxxExxY protein [Chitinivibrionales bacterium]|nr:GxxExxY protein [Chitinivibrionales bacterium]